MSWANQRDYILAACNIAAGASSPLHSYVLVRFSAESQYSGMIDIGAEQSVDSFDVVNILTNHKNLPCGRDITEMLLISTLTR
ncbi:hypothetical protein O9992_17710 [Vibrio lentus]|nr:hypothetical protein [Vibrio lentus]